MNTRLAQFALRLPRVVGDSELEAVVGMLGITDAQKLGTARNWIYSALEDFKTARSQTVKAKPIREDRQDLKELVEATCRSPKHFGIEPASDAPNSSRRA